MPQNFDELRNTIREILEAHALSESNSKRCSWMIIEEFGARVLQEIGYEDDYDVIDIVKEKCVAEGWNYDEF